MFSTLAVVKYQGISCSQPRKRAACLYFISIAATLPGSIWLPLSACKIPQGPQGDKKLESILSIFIQWNRTIPPTFPSALLSRHWVELKLCFWTRGSAVLPVTQTPNPKCVSLIVLPVSGSTKSFFLGPLRFPFSLQDFSPKKPSPLPSKPNTTALSGGCWRKSGFTGGRTHLCLSAKRVLCAKWTNFLKAFPWKPSRKCCYLEL